MTFHWPLLLWALLIPAFWLAFDLARLRRHKSTTAAAPSKIIQAEATRTSLRISPFALHSSLFSKPRWRFCLGLAFATIALARPQWGRIEEPIFDQSREILIALDLSRSMLAPDVKPNRLDRAKLLITSLLERLEGERVGLVVFAGTSFLQSPLSADYEILRDFLPSLNPDFLPQGGSNYRALLDTSIEAFGTEASADRYLIILSDGEATDDNWKPLADDLKKKSIRVIGLGIGTAEGAMIPDNAGGFVKDERGAVVLSKLENSTLQQLAETTSGTYTDASAWVDLAQLINTTVEAGRKGAFLERNRVRLAERFQWALAPALLFLAWSYWREFPVRPRSRDIELKTSTPPPLPPRLDVARATREAALTVGALLLLSAFGLRTSTFAADAAPDPAASIAAPLSTLVGNLSGRDSLAARDCAQIASTTITYGERLQTAKHPVPEGPIRDALLAVDQGEAADAKAADWPDLRAKLKKFLEKSEPPPQQDQEKKDEEKKDQQDKQDKQDSQNQSGKPEDKSEQEKQDQQQQKSDSSKSQDASKSQQDQQQQDSQSSQENKEPPKDQQSAFGKMDQKPPEEKTPQEVPAPSEETQKIGGAPENKSTVPVDPSLSVPLQKLDQVRELDSPGRLFQLMQDPKAKPEKPGKDW